MLLTAAPVWPKDLCTEADLQPYAVQYFKHAITAKQGWFAIQGVLMASGYYTAQSLYNPTIQQADKQPVDSSLQQLQVWLQMANAELSPSAQASPAKLELLLKRCSVKVLYMQLYASLCLQTREKLQEIAVTVGASVEELLQRTNGPWLLGELCLQSCISLFFENHATCIATQYIETWTWLWDDCRLYGATSKCHRAYSLKCA